VQTGYSGKRDFADSAYAHAIAGDATFAAEGEVDCGDSTITCGGDFDNSTQTTWTTGTSTVVLTGTSKILTIATANTFSSLTITGTITKAAGGNIAVWGAVDIQGTLTVNDGQLHCTSSTVDVSGTLTGAGTFRLVTGSIDTMTGTWSIADSNVQRAVTFTPAGTFGGDWVFDGYNVAAYTLTLGTGTRTFTGGVILRGGVGTGGYIVDNSAGGSLVFQGDLEIDEEDGVTYTKGAGTMSFTGANPQTITTPAAWTDIFEAVTVNKTAGNVVLAGDLYCVSFTGTSTGTGTFDPGGNEIATTGACDWASGFDMVADVDAMNGCTWDVGGNFTADGQDLNATAAWYLTAVASGAGSVAYSDASGFTEISASGWADNGGNTNWSLGQVTAGGNPFSGPIITMM
jgi:hypothetical protein